MFRLICLSCACWAAVTARSLADDPKDRFGEDFKLLQRHYWVRPQGTGKDGKPTPEVRLVFFSTKKGGTRVKFVLTVKTKEKDGERETSSGFTNDCLFVVEGEKRFIAVTDGGGKELSRIPYKLSKDRLVLDQPKAVVIGILGDKKELDLKGEWTPEKDGE